MNWDALYALTNGWAILGWIALAFLPRNPQILAAILYAGVALLCLTYAVLLGGVLFGGWDVGGPSAAMDFTSLSGVMALFATKGGAAIGWTHYLAFDLFVGMWIARDADQKGFARLVQLPFLILTLMTGPVGLLAWLLTRERRARASARTR